VINEQLNAASEVTEYDVAELIVAIPARNEQDTIAGCVTSIDEAAARAALPTLVVIAADSCHDQTARIAAEFPVGHCRVSVLEGSWGGAGAARQAAVAHGLSISRVASHQPRRVWIANTDADTVVPPTWLATHLRYAATHHAIAGIVDLDSHEVPAELLHRFRLTYHIGDDIHDHVHGANLGVRADVYLSVGGWCPQTTVGEDHGLWNRLIDVGATIRHSTHLRVITSGRVVSRVEGGFASNLRALVRQPCASTPDAIPFPGAQPPTLHRVGDDPIDELVA
jgi:glycosyltransferase involved in cell wall biosynthesis